MAELGAILIYIADGAARWALSRVLDATLQAATGVSVGAKLDRLLAAPFVAGESALHLAQSHPTGSRSQIEELRKARDCFHHAAAQLTELVRCHAQYLAGVCSDMLDDDVARRYYFGEALATIGVYCEDVIARHKAKAETLAVTGKAALMGAAFLAPIPVLGWIKGLLLGANGAALLGSSRRLLENCPNPELDKMPASEFTVGALKAALQAAISR